MLAKTSTDYPVASNRANLLETRLFYFLRPFAPQGLIDATKSTTLRLAL